MKSVSLKDISLPTTANAYSFMAVAGEIEQGKSLMGALNIGTSYSRMKGDTGTVEPYIELYPEIGIDGSYTSFFHADRSNNEKFSNFSKAIKAYNNNILSKTIDPAEAEKYMIRNVPAQSQDLIVEYMRSEFYGGKPESCIVLDYVQSPENENEYFALLYKDGKYGVAENVSLDRRNRPDLREIKRPKFEEDINQVLSEYVTKSKTEVIFGKNEEEKQEEIIAEQIDVSNPVRTIDDDDAR